MRELENKPSAAHPADGQDIFVLDELSELLARDMLRYDRRLDAEEEVREY